ncbi:MAG TPA: sigma-54-dependent Fis family transcriptional regulator [Verrucomicrobiae bacterium]|nr:sigma-54-dependent Fis family transcriptional regulator [Verrucomicrobiae bacterium]
MKEKARHGLAVVPGSPTGGPATPEFDPFPSALSRIARIVSGTLELKDVFSQVADVAREIIPFDTMGVCRIVGPNTLRRYAIAGEMAERHKCEEDGEDVRFEDFSPAMRPDDFEMFRMDDAETGLDLAFPMDREILEKGVRSMLSAPLVSGKRISGEVYLLSPQPATFTEQHERYLAAISDILSLSLEHERLASLEGERRRRLDAIDALLPAIAGTLDLRGIFDRVSEIAREVLPHDRLILTSRGVNEREMIVEAVSGEPIPGMPDRFSAGAPGDCTNLPDHVLIPDTDAQPTKCGARDAAHQIGMRSFLGIPMHLDTGTSWLIIVSRTPGQYSEEDVIVGRRLGDHVALALSHQRLAGEERRAAQASERANRLEERVQVLSNQLETTLGYRRVLGEAKPWKAVLSQAAKVAQTETTVLLTGESGTGKEVVARFIHRGSPRSGGPFAALNCAALPDTLLESELFGHERGAFTGATTSRPGRIEQAAGGVLFLDEVAEMTTAVQAKLLRVLQEREFQRLGGTRTLRADVRIIAATNKDLEGMVANGTFREDLFYRLRVFEIGLPALRERQQDILPMAEAFLDEIGALIGRKAAGISREAHVALQSYHWPGNVRELRNALERATILCDGGLITLEHLPFSVGRSNGRGNGRKDGAAGRPMLTASEGFPTGDIKLKDVERDMILRALHESGNNRSRAARLLGITRSQLYTKLQRHNIEA